MTPKTTAAAAYQAAVIQQDSTVECLNLRPIDSLEAGMHIFSVFIFSIDIISSILSAAWPNG